jgi:hypothetical protein
LGDFADMAVHGCPDEGGSLERFLVFSIIRRPAASLNVLAR